MNRHFLFVGYLLFSFVAATPFCHAQSVDFGNVMAALGKLDDLYKSPDVRKMVRPYPAITVSAWLDDQGLVVNDTNEDHAISIHYSYDFEDIKVLVTGLRLVRWFTFDRKDVESRGGLVRVFCHGGNDDVDFDLQLPLDAYGGSGDDVIRGGPYDDHLWGESGNDRIVGNAGDDWIYGGTGNDRFAGGDGSDYLFGGDGDDVLDQYDPNPFDDPFERLDGDAMVGGAGRDTFVVDSLFDQKVDFDSSEDQSY